jgi:hypothetical protein
MPPIDAQFFYSSLIPIDDPLSTSSIIGGSSDPKSGRIPLRPFSHGDNTALEKAWLGLQSDTDRSAHQDARNGHIENPDTAKQLAEKRSLLVQGLALRHWDRHRSGFQPQDLAVPIEFIPSAPNGTVCCSQLVIDADEELERTFCSLTRLVEQTLTPERVIHDVMSTIDRFRQLAAKPARDEAAPDDDGSTTRSRAASASQPVQEPSKESISWKVDGRHELGHNKHPTDAVRDSIARRSRSNSQATERSSQTSTPVGSPHAARLAGSDAGISGKPFVRVGTSTDQPPPSPKSFQRFDNTTTTTVRDDVSEAAETLGGAEVEAARHAEAVKAGKYGRDSAEVAVGISRLHMVSLPTLQMKPIYWSPVNDLAFVTRATWFYRHVEYPALHPLIS